MVRNLALIAAMFGVAFSAQSARAQDKMDHAEHFMKCAKVAADCQLQCDSCFKHCLMMLGEGMKEHAKTVQFCADCAESCKTCATLCARQSPLAKPMLECCAKCCDDCAASCAQMPNDKQLAACARSCRECAAQCREMLKQIGK